MRGKTVKLRLWQLTLAFCALALLAPSLASADLLVRALTDAQQRRRGNLGGMYLVRITAVEDAPNNMRIATVETLGRPEVPPGEFMPRTYAIHNVMPNFTLPPLDRPAIMRLRLLANERAAMAPVLWNDNQTHFIDRGLPGERFYDTTIRLVFTHPRQFDRDTFYKELLDLAGDDDPNVAALAASFIGSSLNVYATRECPERIVELFADFIIERRGSQLAEMASFFERTRLPRDPQRILALLAHGDRGVAGPVRDRFAQERNRAGELARTMSGAMLATDGPPVREHLLHVALAWGKAAEPLWAAAQELVVDAERLGVSQTDQALAAQVLVNIDPARARDAVRGALHRLDSQAIYRFVYEQRMYETAGTLIDALRNGTTRHAGTVQALLAALTRNTSFDNNARWIAWWDELVQTGQTGEAIERQFVPAGDEGRLIETLVNQLGEDDYNRRRQAMMRLHAIGPVANPRLEAALHHPDAEVALAAEQILAENGKQMEAVIDSLYGRSGQANRRPPPPAAQ